MAKNIFKTLRTFVYKCRLNRDPDKWVIELGEDESKALAIKCYEICGSNDIKNKYECYRDTMTFEEFMDNKIYLQINTFRGVTIEWFKHKLVFREKRKNG